MKLMIRKTGGATVDTGQLTAAPEDVAHDAKFYGAGSDDIQTGTVPSVQAAEKLDANGSVTIPAGIISQDSYVYQQIPLQEAITIQPVAEGSYIGVQGKYMVGDIIITGIENLKPENIRNGAFVSSVAGTWEGFVNNDVLTPYWKGIFAPGQTGELMDNRPGVVDHDLGRVIMKWQHGNPVPDGQYISMTSTSDYSSRTTVYPAFRFAVPIEMEGVKSVSIMYQLPSDSANSYTWMVISQGTDYYVADRTWKIRPDLGAHEIFVLPASEGWTTRTFTINNARQYHYIHVGLGVSPSKTQDRAIYVRSIRLNK